MQLVVDAIWEAHRNTGVSWVGFYIADETVDADQRLVLGARRDSPACSPIGLTGVCGSSYTSRTIQIVDDVATLGDQYIPCDPRDQSEIVIPLLTTSPAGEEACWGVLDLDSHKVGAFDEHDAHGLADVLRAVGFVTPSPPERGQG